eukprot:m.127301 g.127301  ORF g.127301 m.127301 type:complete len:118 (+) comp15799_c0_seq9:611-964(+)
MHVTFFTHGQRSSHAQLLYNVAQQEYHEEPRLSVDDTTMMVQPALTSPLPKSSFLLAFRVSSSPRSRTSRTVPPTKAGSRFRCSVWRVTLPACRSHPKEAIADLPSLRFAFIDQRRQ